MYDEIFQGWLLKARLDGIIPDDGREIHLKWADFGGECDSFAAGLLADIEGLPALQSRIVGDEPHIVEAR